MQTSQTTAVDRSIRYRMGIDLGGTKVEAVVLDEAGHVIVRERRPTPVSTGYEAIISAIQDLVSDIESQVSQRCHVGIGTPGAIIPESGLLKNSNTVCMNGKPVLRDLETALSRSVRIQNDANCFALSEATNGAGAGASVVFGVIMGTGVGGAVVVHGQVVTGLHHIGGEWGHNQLEKDGPVCYCGRTGCVETLLSGPGILADHRRHQTPSPSNDNSESALDAKMIVQLANNGNPDAQATLDRFLKRFGRAMATVVNILDPDIIVLGGGVSNINELYTEGHREMSRHVFTDTCRTALCQNSHGDSSGVFGAAMLWDPEPSHG